MQEVAGAPAPAFTVGMQEPAAWPGGAVTCLLPALHLPPQSFSSLTQRLRTSGTAEPWVTRLMPCPHFLPAIRATLTLCLRAFCLLSVFFCLIPESVLLPLRPFLCPSFPNLPPQQQEFKAREEEKAGGPNDHLSKATKTSKTKPAQWRRWSGSVPRVG